jgi:L-ascorbate metabolism protein UlaG (beta-lactamase superfamily)
MIPAVHGSAIKIDELPIYAGVACGYLFNLDGFKVYHAGDTGLFSDMKLLADEQVDVALIPIGGRYTMGIEEAVQAIHYIKPKTVIPMHFNTFDSIKVDPNEFIQKIYNYKAKILNIGEFIEI